MSKFSKKKMPESLLKRLNTLINPGENILLFFQEPYRWHEMQDRWLVLTEMRLLIVYKTLFGVTSIDEIHLRDLDIEYVMTKFGCFDSLLFRTRDHILYQTGTSRFHREEVEDFVKTATSAITRREGAFRSGLKQTPPSSGESIKTLHGLNGLRHEGAITEAEYNTKKTEVMKKIVD